MVCKNIIGSDEFYPPRSDSKSGAVNIKFLCSHAHNRSINSIAIASEIHTNSQLTLIESVPLIAMISSFVPSLSTLTTKNGTIST